MEISPLISHLTQSTLPHKVGFAFQKILTVKLYMFTTTDQHVNMRRGFKPAMASDERARKIIMAVDLWVL